MRVFRDNAQRSRVCVTLLAIAGLEHLWSDPGPAGIFVLSEDFSGAKRTFLRAAGTFWNGSRRLSMSDVIDHLDADHAEALCFLVMAIKHGADAVDDWLAEYSIERRTS
jgi:hypothetical protein